MLNNLNTNFLSALRTDRVKHIHSIVARKKSFKNEAGRVYYRDMKGAPQNSRGPSMGKRGKGAYLAMVNFSLTRLIL